MNEFFTNNQSSVVTSKRILYTPSAFARSSLLYLQELGELKARKVHMSGRENLSSYLFFSVVDGAGSLFYDGKEYSLSNGDMVFIDCEKPYKHITSEDKLWTLRWVHFYGTALPVIYKKYCERGGKNVIHPEKTAAFHTEWESLMTLAGGEDYIRDMRINEILSRLLTLLMEQSWHPENQEALPKKKSMITPVKEYLDANYTSKITLDELASKFYINKYYMLKTFKEQYGQPINAYLLGLRITKAKQLLRFTDKTVEAIGLECGFGTVHYFSSKFKEIEGVPPGKYRKQW